MDAFQDHRFMVAPPPQPPPPPPPPPPGGDPSFHPPPPPPYYHHHQQQQPFPHQETPNYPPFHHHYHQPPHPPPPPQYQQQWPHLDGHLQQQHHQGMLPPPPQIPPYPQYPSPYPGAAGPPPPQQPYDMPPLPPHHYQYPPPPHAAAPVSHPALPPSRPHGHHHLSPSPPPPPPSSSAFHPPLPPPPNQGWGSQTWAQHQGWEYPERNFSYNNGDDWAPRDKVWAPANFVAENHRSQVMPTGRVEEHSFARHDQNQAADGPTDNQQPSFSQSSNQHSTLHMMDQQKQVNFFHGLASYTAGSTSYGAEGHDQSNAGDQTIAPHNVHISPTRNYGPTSSIYEQEVPYSYSSNPGNRVAVNQIDSLQNPVSYSAQEGFTGLQSTLPERNMPTDKPNFGHDGQPINYIGDASNQPLDFDPRPASNLEVRPKTSYGLAVVDPVGTTGVMDHDAIGTSLNAWTPASLGVFPQPLAPSGTQFDSSFASQQPLSVQHAPLFGGLPGPSFRPNIPHVNAPFGLGAEHISQAAGYAADINGAFNIPERPKKSAVPKWLQEEIIKNKSVIASHQAGSSYESPDSEHVKSYRRNDQDDQKSIDSTKSTEDDEDDEDAVEAARSAAINQEIKRILTEVLLKVTDEFFDQIATKVLNEDDLTIEATEHNDLGNHKVTVPSVLTPKASAKILLPVKDKSNKTNGVSDKSGPPSLGGGDILGLASYASDEEDDDANQSSKLLPSGMMVQESDGGSFGNEPKRKRVETGDALTNKGEADVVPHDIGYERKGENTNDNPQSVNTGDGGASKLMQRNSMSDELHNEKAHTGLYDIGGRHKSFDSGLSKDSVDKKEYRRLELTGGDAKTGKSATKDGHAREMKSTLSTSKHQEKNTQNEDALKKAASKDGISSESINHESRNSLKEKTDNLRKMDQFRSAERGAESDRRSHGNTESRRESTRDKKEKNKHESELKKKIRDKKEDHSRIATKDSAKYTSRRSPSPSNRGRNSKESSSHGHGSISSDEPADNSKKRKLQSQRNSTSPSPTRVRARQVSRSPDRKHSHRRHSPYSSADRRRRRSRSSSPVSRRR